MGVFVTGHAMITIATTTAAAPQSASNIEVRMHRVCRSMFVKISEVFDDLAACDETCAALAVDVAGPQPAAAEFVM